MFEMDTASKLQQMLGIRTNTSVMNKDQTEHLNNSNYPGIYPDRNKELNK